MKLITVTFVILGALSVYGKDVPKFEPSVAFVCDRGAMHMDTKSGWSSDSATDCMEGKDEILAYCKKMYPSLEITNIVESSEYKHIKGWCPLGKTCSTLEAFKVRPYRCLTGPFQSDPLVVPDKCVFDHVHQPDQCHGFQWWSDVAHKACRGLEHMKTESFAMLLPCGTDVFTGVEYVCCPDGSKSDGLAVETTTKSLKDLVKPSVNVKITASKGESAADDASVKEVKAYSAMSQKDFKDKEHSAFSKAKKALLKANREKVTKLMKEWAEARKRVMELKATDPKGAEKLNKEITPRFQNEYFALQTTDDQKVSQLESVHQQHVQTNFDAKKRKAIEKLMEELQKSKPSTAVVTKFLKRYINIEEKDAHHCINHYVKIRGRDSKLGQQMLPMTVEHMTLISTRINQSIDLVSTLKDEKQRKQIRDTVNDWRSKTFNNIDSYIAKFKEQIALLPVAKPVTTTTAKISYEKTTPETTQKEHQKPVIYMSESKSSKITDTGKTFKQFADSFAKTVLVKEKLLNDDEKLTIISNKEENEPEDEHSYKTFSKPELKVNGMAKTSVDIESNHAAAPAAAVSSQSAAVGLSTGTGFAIAIGVIAGVFMVIFSLLIVKKRSGSGKPSRQTYLEVDEEEITAEDRHIAAMQNGYENPTYKLLEQRT